MHITLKRISYLQESTIWTTLFILAILCCPCFSSSGDCSIFFAHCLYSCRVVRCNYSENPNHPLYTSKPFIPRNLTLLERVITWKCDDECKYHCMWWSVEKFQDSGVPPQQFYGRVGILFIQYPINYLISWVYCFYMLFEINFYSCFITC